MNTINSRNLHEVVRLRVLLLFAVRFLNQEAGDWAYGSAGRPSLSLEARGCALSCISVIFWECMTKPAVADS